jgi:hypothetical protein
MMSRQKSTQIALKDAADLLDVSYDKFKKIYPFIAGFPAPLPKRNKHYCVYFNKDDVVAYANSGVLNVEVISVARRAYAAHITSNLPSKKHSREPRPTLDLELAWQFLTAKPIR